MMKHIELRQFILDLSSGSPAPGGGSVAALTGSLGGALLSMVGHLTEDKKNYEEVRGEMKSLVEEANEICSHLFNLINQDIQAFNDVMGAYKLPQETDEDREVRLQATQHALEKATQVPLETMKSAKRVLALSRTALLKGNKNALSDSAIAGQLGWCAIKCAYFNVLINLDSIKNDDFVKYAQGEAGAILKEADRMLEEVNRIVTERFSG
ncbi:cyclodeaminase/cyclohydrolase family protein [bacterium]|nr:cyclodeaminase/cyclohydrolase family protein [bacterium]